MSNRLTKFLSIWKFRIISILLLKKIEGKYFTLYFYLIDDKDKFIKYFQCRYIQNDAIKNWKKYMFSRNYFSEEKIDCMRKVSNIFYIAIRNLLIDYLSE